ncbi:MAG TPA: carbohydrate ABC transporter permease, partial [Aestuariivirgaceae bacterium]
MSARLLRGLTAAVILLAVLLPIYWMAAASLKSNKEITQDATLYPHAPSLDNYVRLLSQKQFDAFLLNSLVVTAASVALALGLGALAAYAIARFRLRFRLERVV